MTGPGLRLCQDFYHQAAAPLLAGTEHSAALLGAGSEVLGFDDQVSTDHDFSPRVQIFLPPGADPAPVLAALAALPARFRGHAVHPPAAARGETRPGPPPAPTQRVQVTTAEGFFTTRIGTDPASGMTLADWLLTPTQVLASLTAGAVFHDPAHHLSDRRATLAWYPDDLWRYALAAGWLRVSQEQAFVGRAGSRGDVLGASIVTARVARDLMRLAFLAERRWAPYSKWFDHAFQQLALAERLRPELMLALSAPAWREQESALCAAAAMLGEATNQLALADPVDPSPHRYYDRDIRVVNAEGFTRALTDAITDPEVCALLDRLGRRPRSALGALPGTIDQAADSVDILTLPERCRTLAAALGL
jgi:Domain of unknown function (DUF4037)